MYEARRDVSRERTIDFYIARASHRKTPGALLDCDRSNYIIYVSSTLIASTLDGESIAVDEIISCEYRTVWLDFKYSRRGADTREA